MSPAAAFHAQLASIMEVLANTAVAEICELVDSGYAVLQLEISRSRKENELLRRKLRLTELRAARAAALRAAAAASGTAPLLASGRARAQLPAHRPGSEPRRSGTPAGEAAPSQQTLRCGDPEPAGPPTAGIKVEDVDGCWSQPEPDSESSFKEFCRGVGGRTTETEAPPPRGDQEVAEEGGGSTRSWLSGEVSSTSASVRNPLSAGQRSEPSSYDGLMYEPQLQHGSRSTQNPLGEDPGCSYALNASGSGGGFPFAVSEASLSNQQGAPLAADEPQLPVREEVAESQSAFIRRDRWKPQDGVDVAPSHRGDDGGVGKAFVCNCCGKTLACLKNLKTHMRVHTGEKPFVCALCGKRFSDSSNLKRHQSVHTGEKRYGCAHCGKRFAQSGSLKVHMSVHTECKQFRCSYCGKTFISGSHLRRHVTVHGGEKRFAPALQ